MVDYASVVPVVYSPRVSPSETEDSGTFNFSFPVNNPDGGTMYVDYEIWQNPVLEGADGVDDSTGAVGTGLVSHGGQSVPGVTTEIVYRHIRANTDNRIAKVIKNYAVGRIISTDTDTSYPSRIQCPASSVGDSMPVGGGEVIFSFDVLGGDCDVTYKITYTGTKEGTEEGVILESVTFDEIEATVNVTSGGKTISYTPPTVDNPRIRLILFQIVGAVATITDPDGLSTTVTCPYCPIPARVRVITLDSVTFTVTSSALSEE